MCKPGRLGGVVGSSGAPASTPLGTPWIRPLDSTPWRPSRKQQLFLVPSRAPSRKPPSTSIIWYSIIERARRALTHAARAGRPGHWRGREGWCFHGRCAPAPSAREHAHLHALAAHEHVPLRRDRCSSMSRITIVQRANSCSSCWGWCGAVGGAMIVAVGWTRMLRSRPHAPAMVPWRTPETAAAVLEQTLGVDLFLFQKHGEAHSCQPTCTSLGEMFCSVGACHLVCTGVCVRS